MAGKGPDDDEGEGALQQRLAETLRTNARLAAELAQKTRDIEILQQVSAEITSTLDLDELCGIILEALARALGFRHIMILLATTQEKLEVIASRGYPESATGAIVKFGQGVVGVVAARRKLMRVSNVGYAVRYLSGVRARMVEEGQLAEDAEERRPPGLPGVQSEIAIPLLVKDRLVGVLAVESAEANAFDELDEMLLTILANQTATAIENARSHQVLEKLERLKRFFSRQLAELIVAGDAEDPLQTHRRDITVVFLDLRGFTAFAESVEPEEVMGVLREFHEEMGELIEQFEGTLERFTGDGMMIFFNDPVPMIDAAERAARMAVAMQERVQVLGVRWRKKGYELALGVGIASGYATLGAIGFERRWDYGAIGNVTNLAARLCGEARGGQILVSQRVAGEIEDGVELADAESLTLKGMARPVKAFAILGPKRPEAGAGSV